MADQHHSRPIRVTSLRSLEKGPDGENQNVDALLYAKSDIAFKTMASVNLRTFPSFILLVFPKNDGNTQLMFRLDNGMLLFPVGGNCIKYI